MKKITALLSMLVIFTGFQKQSFTLQSNDIHGRFTRPFVYDKYHCGGRNLSPELHWSGAPAGTQSFAVSIFDPDAPTGKGWWHWLVFDIPANVQHLPRGAGDASGRGLPPGAIQWRNDYGETGYGGPCPPRGDPAHRYIFTVYALDTAHLDVPQDAPPGMLAVYLNRHALAKASFTAYYGRE